jgi:hypothetical protein
MRLLCHTVYEAFMHFAAVPPPPPPPRRYACANTPIPFHCRICMSLKTHLETKHPEKRSPLLPIRQYILMPCAASQVLEETFSGLRLRLRGSTMGVALNRDVEQLWPVLAAALDRASALQIVRYCARKIQSNLFNRDAKKAAKQSRLEQNPCYG